MPRAALPTLLAAIATACVSLPQAGTAMPPAAPANFPIAGIVRLPGGAPAVGATVIIANFFDVHPPGPGRNDDLGIRSFTTDSRGAFAGDGFAAGEYALSVFVEAPPGFAPPKEEFTARAGRTDLILEVHSLAYVRGRVVGPSGPLAAHLIGSEFGDAEMEGRFQIALRLAKPLVFEVDAKGHEPKTVSRPDPRPFEVIDVGDVELEVAPPRNGRVVDDAGSPVAGAVIAEGRAGAKDLQVRTDVDGRFQMPKGLGMRSLTVAAKGFPTQEFPVKAADRQWTFTLQRGGKLAGRVAVAKGPKLAEMRVFAALDGRNGVEATVSPDGTFEIGDVLPGQYRAVAIVDAPGVRYPTTLVTVVAGQTARVEFHPIEGAATAQFEIVDTAGRVVRPSVLVLVPGSYVPPSSPREFIRDVSMFRFGYYESHPNAHGPGDEAFAGLAPGHFTVIGLREQPSVYHAWPIEVGAGRTKIRLTFPDDARPLSKDDD